MTETKEYTGVKHRTGDPEVDAFIMELEQYAVDNGVLITDIAGWTKVKLNWMAKNNKRCCCAPAKRSCPCQEGLIEALKTSPQRMCLCSVFKHPNKKG